MSKKNKTPEKSGSEIVQIIDKHFRDSITNNEFKQYEEFQVIETPNAAGKFSVVLSETKQINFEVQMTRENVEKWVSDLEKSKQELEKNLFGNDTCEEVYLQQEARKNQKEYDPKKSYKAGTVLVEAYENAIKTVKSALDKGSGLPEVAMVKNLIKYYHNAVEESATPTSLSQYEQDLLEKSIKAYREKKLEILNKDQNCCSDAVNTVAKFNYGVENDSSYRRVYGNPEGSTRKFILNDVIPDAKREILKDIIENFFNRAHAVSTNTQEPIAIPLKDQQPNGNITFGGAITMALLDSGASRSQY